MSILSIVILALGVVSEGSQSTSQSEAADTDQLRFDVASVRPEDPSYLRSDAQFSPGGITLRGTRITHCIQRAYGVTNFQVEGPNWIVDNRYAIVAKTSKPATLELLNRMLQTLLTERFHLVLKHGTKEMMLMALTVAPGGPKFGGSEGDSMTHVVRPNPAEGRSEFQAATMADLAEHLSGTGVPAVIDQTGLRGRYDFIVNWKRYLEPESEDTTRVGRVNAAMRVAIRKELGLRLELKKVRLETLVVESGSQMPTEN